MEQNDDAKDKDIFSQDQVRKEMRKRVHELQETIERPQAFCQLLLQHCCWDKQRAEQT